MPCFKGLAVSIHTPDGPLPEYSVQKQTRLSRIASYIPVPQPKFSPDSTRLEPSGFAISITLLTAGASVPYSRPRPTPEEPNPKPKIVGGLPGVTEERGQYGAAIAPYFPITQSPHETVAAYIHFDGRAKEEVATLLRRGEETWVNSRWVSVAESEGGGLAEREFLFREVGLERWLNGLDLQGESKEVAARIERRKARLQAKRNKKSLRPKDDSDDDDEDIGKSRLARPLERNGVLRYGEDKQAPVESLSGDDDVISSDSDDSEDDMPVPEAAGQIKVSLFRVLASGEIKKGEYSPQFDATDDDEMNAAQNGNSQDCDADVDHTTTFAKPKTLDPKSISTQTVTGIDPPDKPFATFTFFYRGRRQLQKMGILPTNTPVEQKSTSTKKKPMDFSSLTPLQHKNAAGFAGYREGTAKASPHAGRKPKDEDSDDEDDVSAAVKLGADDEDVNEARGDTMQPELTPEEVAKRGELAEGVKKIQLKRQHSFEAAAPNKSPPRKYSTTSPDAKSGLLLGAFGAAASGLAPPPSSPVAVPAHGGPAPSTAAPLSVAGASGPAEEASPFKKQRASVDLERPAPAPAPASNSGALGASGGVTAQLPDTDMGASNEGDVNDEIHVYKHLPAVRRSASG